MNGISFGRGGSSFGIDAEDPARLQVEIAAIWGLLWKEIPGSLHFTMADLQGTSFLRRTLLLVIKAREKV